MTNIILYSLELVNLLITGATFRYVTESDICWIGWTTF